MHARITKDSLVEDPSAGLGVFPLPLGSCQLEPERPFVLSCRSQSLRALRPERLLVLGNEWSRKGVATLQGLYIEGFPLSDAGAVPLEIFSSTAFGVRLATGGLVLQQGQRFELRGSFRAFEPPPRYWSRLAGRRRDRDWPPPYWSNRAGSLWPSLQAMLLVRFIDPPFVDPPSAL